MSENENSTNNDTEPAAIDHTAEPSATVESPAEGAISNPTPDDGADKPDAAARDVAKYRKRAQAAEKERDQLGERLTRMQRAEAERLAAERLKDGTDLWRDGAQLADLLSDEGDIDSDKIAAVTQTLVTAHPHWRKLAPAAPPASIVTAADKITPGDSRNDFVSAFAPRSK